MKKLLLISLAIVSSIFAYGLDELVPINWNLNHSGGPAYQLTDDLMHGYNDTSIAYEIPDGTVSMTFLWLADTGTTRDSVGDNDSLVLLGKLVPKGLSGTTGYTAFWGLAFGDTIFEGAMADSGSGISTVSRMYHMVQINDSFFVSRVIPPPDTAGGSAALRSYYTGNRYATKWDLQFYAHCSTGDTANINSRFWMIFNSAANNGCSSALGQVGLNKK